MKSLTDLLLSIVPHRHPETAVPPTAVCPHCKADLSQGDRPLYQRYRVCDECGQHLHLSARERIAQLVDVGSFHEVNRSLVSVDPLSFSDRVPYQKRLDEARKKTGATEAVVTGTCRIGGTQTVLAVLDFDFLGGSMGSVVGEKVTLALELAARRKLPIVTVSTSGGARMQEGMLSLVQMAKTSAAARRLHEAKMPFISVLADPTTGGIYASYASLGDVIVAEPRTLMRVYGSRVLDQTAHQELADEVTRAEYLLDHGAVDQIVARPELRDTLIALLATLSPRNRRPDPLPEVEEPEAEQPRPEPKPAWEIVQLARRGDRPTSMALVRAITSGFVELHGDRQGADDRAIVIGLAHLDGQPVAIIAEERGPGGSDDATRGGQPFPEGYRKALRMMTLANKFSLPLLTFIDTPGAFAGLEAQERGLARALAECLSYMSGMSTQTVAVVVGEGGSGGAIALAVADRILMMENAIYSVIAPEGAAAILYRDAARAQELAEALRITAHDLQKLGVIDVVVPEPEGGAQTDPGQAADLVKQAVLRSLIELQHVPLRKTLKARYQKFRRMGQYNRYFNQAVSREVSQLQEYMQRRVQDIREHWPGRRSHAAAEAAVSQP